MMKHLKITPYTDAVARQSQLTQYLVVKGLVPVSTEKYCTVREHTIQDIGAIPLLPGFAGHVSDSGLFTQQELDDASELTADWFWHYPDRPIRLQLPTAKLIEQPYDGLFSYLRTAWQALGVTPYPVTTDGNETIVYLEELTDITVDGQVITASQIAAMPSITVEYYGG